MHESPVARQLVEAALEHARLGDDERVANIVVRLGPDGGFVPESLRMHMMAAATGTAVEGAEVEITLVPRGGAEIVSLEVERGS